jgi:hypothetical protein
MLTAAEVAGNLRALSRPAALAAAGDRGKDPGRLRPGTGGG